MNSMFLSAVLLLGVTQAAQADTPDRQLATSSRDLSPNESIDVLPAVLHIVAAGHADNAYPVDINAFTFTSPDDDDENSPIAVNQMPNSIEKN